MQSDAKLQQHTGKMTSMTVIPKHSIFPRASAVNELAVKDEVLFYNGLPGYAESGVKSSSLIGRQESYG